MPTAAIRKAFAATVGVAVLLLGCGHALAGKGRNDRANDALGDVIGIGALLSLAVIAIVFFFVVVGLNKTATAATSARPPGAGPALPKAVARSIARKT